MVMRTPPPGLPYHRLQASSGRLRSAALALLGVALLGITMMLIAPTVVSLLFLAAYLVRHPGRDSDAFLVWLSDPTPLSPETLAYLSLSLAAAIAITAGLSVGLHRLRPRWLASVGPGIRWRWLAACFGLAALTLLVTVLVSTLLPAAADPAATGTGSDLAASTIREFVLVLVFLVPLQAVGEEYAFRGYLTQAFGGVVGSAMLARVVAVAVPALLFAFAHGAQDGVVFLDRFTFGVAAGVLVIVTGGLEAGIAMHVLNNWLAFGVALMSGTMAEVLTPSSDSLWPLVVTVTRSVVYVGLVWWLVRRWGLRTVTDGSGHTGRRPDFAPGRPRM